MPITTTRRLPSASSYLRCIDAACCTAAFIACTAGATLVAVRQPDVPARRTVEAILSAEASGAPFTLSFFNRPIATFRARVLGREPADRAAAAEQVLDALVANHVRGPVRAAPLEGAFLITVGGRTVFALTPADADELSADDLGESARTAAVQLEHAIGEAYDAQSPQLIALASGASVIALAVGCVLVIGVGHARRAATAILVAFAERSAARSRIADPQLLHASRVIEFERRLVSVVAGALNLAIGYAIVSFVLRQFPYSRPWGERMRGFLLITVKNLTLGMANAVPGLVAVVLILLVTRFLVRLIGMWFNAVGRGRIVPPKWLHPETAEPTRRLVTAFAWLVALVALYPYLPGSETDAFKGIGVLVGLMVTLGSSGLVTQIMSSFMITYSRAVRVGDFVKIGDVEGTVTLVGMLSTKIQTVWNEEVTIPNAVVISQTTTDFSRLADRPGVFTPVVVTIGYDAPWRQVDALLQMAAVRTPGVRADPRPFVLQTALEDFFVRYTVFVSLERQDARPFTLAALHANIQDVFNQYQVQIMSPHYVVDPAAPKLVPNGRWFASPAAPATNLAEIGNLRSEARAPFKV
jgi:small-conductance mechanosensitive channel